MRDFHDLQVWQKSHSLTLGIYRVSGAFPPQEIYGLSSQIRRAAASIPANLAEGCGRNGNAELLRFCSIAMGSELVFSVPDLIVLSVLAVIFIHISVISTLTVAAV